MPDCTPVNVKIEGEEIVLRIPIAALPGAVPIAADAAYGFGNHSFEVSDAAIFAKELLGELKRESETGETMITRMLDAAAVKAIENGVEGISGSIVEVR